MPNPAIRPIVIRCPHATRCNSKQGSDEIICELWGGVKTEVLKRDLCVEARGERHAQKMADRFEQASVNVDTHFEVRGDEIE